MTEITDLTLNEIVTNIKKKKNLIKKINKIICIKILKKKKIKCIYYRKF